MPDYTLIRTETFGRDESVNIPAQPCRTPYAMAYVQPQCWENVLCAEEALSCGSAFRSLIMPFLGKGAYR